MFNKIRRALDHRFTFLRAADATNLIPDYLALQEHRARIAASKNPLNRFGGKTFSQADEDGIIAEICRRLKIARGTYCEYGLGDGLECNTLALAAQGWRGFWISGEDIAFDPQGISPTFFRFDKQWIGHDSVVSLFKTNVSAMGLDGVDLLSFDLDSNDLFYVSHLLEAGVKPRVFVVEYNAKFMPPIRWTTRREENARWTYTDYMGASLQSFTDLLDRHGYTLVCCNAATGANAFFVRTEEMQAFQDVPTDIHEIFMSPNFRKPMRHGHPSEARTVRMALELGEKIAAGTENPEFDIR